MRNNPVSERKVRLLFGAIHKNSVGERNPPIQLVNERFGYFLGLSIKDVRSQGWLSNAYIFRTKGVVVFRCDVHTFWCKNFGFSKFMVCPHVGGGGLSQ